jgi:hypothetical protein
MPVYQLLIETVGVEAVREVTTISLDRDPVRGDVLDTIEGSRRLVVEFVPLTAEHEAVTGFRGLIRVV